MSESDGVEEAFEGQVRIGLLVAGRVGEELARQRERAARAAREQSVQAARDLQERLAVERAMVRASLVPLEREAWWERATPRDIETAWQSAQQWQGVEPDAARATETIREQLRTRYGINLDTLDPDRQDTVTRAMADRADHQRQMTDRAAHDAEHERARADQERLIATLLVTEATDELDAAEEAPPGGQDAPVLAREDATHAEHEAAHQTTQAADADRRAGAAAAQKATAQDASARAQGRTDAANAAPTPVYDSTQRRTQTHERLQAALGPEHADGIKARMVADTANARPAGDIAQQREAAAPAKNSRRATFSRRRGQANNVER